MSYYIDTSILVAYYCPEHFSHKAEEIISKNECIISSLSTLEFASALSQKVQLKVLKQELAFRIFHLFEDHVRQNIFQVQAIQSKHFLTAAAWLKNFNTKLRALDSLHAALCFTESFLLVTSDKILAKESKALGIKLKLID